MLSIVKSHSKSFVYKNRTQSSKFTDTVKFTVPDLTVNGERLGCEQTATPHLIVAASAYIIREMLAAQGFAPIRRNHREQRRLAQGLFMLIEPRSADQDGHAPYATVLDGFIELGRFLRQRASPE